ncbi:unnamed protein product, partial [Symbiodinium sp. CCMP2592]
MDVFNPMPTKRPKTDVFVANVARDYILLEGFLNGTQDKVQADKLYLKGNGNFIMHKLKLSGDWDSGCEDLDSAFVVKAVLSVSTPPVDRGVFTFYSIRDPALNERVTKALVSRCLDKGQRFLDFCMRFTDLGSVYDHGLEVAFDDPKCALLAWMSSADGTTDIMLNVHRCDSYPAGCSYFSKKWSPLC